MGLAAEMAALLPYRLRPGVYDVDSREGFALLNLYAYSPDAYGCPCGVRTFSTRKPQVILSDGTRVEYAPKVAAGAMEAGEVPNMDVLEYVAIRYTARDIIRRLAGFLLAAFAVSAIISAALTWSLLGGAA